MMIPWPVHDVRSRCGAPEGRPRGGNGRVSASLALLAALAIVDPTQAATTGDLPGTFTYARCSTLAEALPGLVTGAGDSGSLVARYESAAIAIRDPDRDGLVCERGCALSILKADDTLERYGVAHRKAALATDLTFGIAGGAAIYRSLSLKIEGGRWLVLGIASVTGLNGDRSDRILDTAVVDAAQPSPASNTRMKVASCLERP